MQPRRATTEDAEAFVAVLIEVAEENRWIGTEPGFDVAERTARVRGSPSTRATASRSRGCAAATTVAATARCARR